MNPARVIDHPFWGAVTVHEAAGLDQVCADLCSAYGEAIPEETVRELVRKAWQSTDHPGG